MPNDNSELALYLFPLIQQLKDGNNIEQVLQKVQGIKVDWSHKGKKATTLNLQTAVSYLQNAVDLAKQGQAKAHEGMVDASINLLEWIAKMA